MALVAAVACDATAGDRSAGATPSPRTTSGTAQVNGTSLRYEERGLGHPLVLLQGGQLTFHMWDEQFDEFSERYRVIRYDVRGFVGTHRRALPRAR